MKTLKSRVTDIENRLESVGIGRDHRAELREMLQAAREAPASEALNRLCDFAKAVEYWVL